MRSIRSTPRRSNNPSHAPVRILIAPDKFKGTLTAREAAEAIGHGWRKSRPDDTLTLLPISDGGDGFGCVLGDALGAKPQRITTVDAAHRKCVSMWWWQAQTRTAIIESANVIGLAMLPPGKFHPFKLDTFGLGKVIHAAAKKGAKKIILGIGGSATNDGGFGLARALGWEFLDARGQRIERWTQLHTLEEIRHSGTAHLACPFPKPSARSLPSTSCAPTDRLEALSHYASQTESASGLKLPKIIVAVDVENPLLGKRGATRVYGPQKGLRADEFVFAEKNLRRLAMVVERLNRRKPLTPSLSPSDGARVAGAGAAGGLGYGLATFARGELRPGFELLAKTTRLASYLDGCDLVITGEGSLDASTLMGKGAGSLAELCRARKIPVIGLAGIIHESPKLKRLFTQTGALTQLTTPVQARERAAHWLGILAEQTARGVAVGILARR